jgi:16S rRNA G966 N2-methylase RsmD
MTLNADASSVAAPRLTEGGSGGALVALPTEVAVKRSDPIYNAHAYLTKVPYSAILPFIQALTEPGETVLDIFAGSGMTGVAAVIAGRHAELRDISVLGRHIGENYVRLADRSSIHAASERVMAAANQAVGEVYASRCNACASVATLSKTVWSVQYECGNCHEPITYYEAYQASAWVKRAIICPVCCMPFQTRGARRIGEVPVLDYVRCDCSERILEQPHSSALVPVSLDGFESPDVEIGPERQMFHASALRKHGLLTTASFFSDRNLAVLTALHRAITDERSSAVRSKLRFAFTAILTRASKRYQWHPKRPLNAANQNYYIAPIFYEWNVYELFERKVRAALRSDQFIRAEMKRNGVASKPRARYEICSADQLDLPDLSVDYVFTDPPFGSQIFYSDMNLFQEVWLGAFTDHQCEAVVDRSRNGAGRRSMERYELLIACALRECHRVLRDDGWLSLVFSNTNGEMWSLLQRAILAAGFTLQHVTLLDKGQRSVKGLTSGFESVVTSDLILSMRKQADDQVTDLADAPKGALHSALDEALAQPGQLTPTRVYLWVVTKYLRNGWRLSDINIGEVRSDVVSRGYSLDPATGFLIGQLPIAA